MRGERANALRAASTAHELARGLLTGCAMTSEQASKSGFDEQRPGTPAWAWTVALQDVPRWDLPPGPLTVVAPHPDDETLGAGGVIALAARRGQAVTIVAVTDGEAAPVHMDALAQLRLREQERALEALGAKEAHIVRLELPDGEVTARTDALSTALELLVPPGTTLLAPWRHDGHPDHEACARAAERAAETAGARLYRYPIWAWHHRGPEHLPWPRLRRMDLPDWAAAAKRRAVACYESQLRPPKDPPVVPPHVEAHFHRPFEVFIA